MAKRTHNMAATGFILESAPVAFGEAYVNEAPTNTVAPAISGTVREGQTLTCSTGTWTDIEALSYTYQWKRDGVSIGGATANTRVLSGADIGAVMTCTVTADDGELTASATSAGTSAVLPAAPVNTVVPAITGTAQQGQTLTAGNGTWTSTPTPTYTYQWKRGGVNISAATNSTYVLVADDVGSTITVAVTATNAGGNATATSSATATVTVPAPVNTVLPAITGTATEGQTLTVSNGTWSWSPSSYTYQWQRGGSNISAATASIYVLVDADVGSTITCEVTATNATGSTMAESSATASVAAATVLLLHCDGANNSTTLTDDSAQATSFNYAGTAGRAIKTDQSKFGGASLWGIATGGYVASADNAAHDFGSGKFTIDAWIRGAVGWATGPVVAKYNAGGGAGSFSYRFLVGPNSIQFILSTSGSAGTRTISATPTIADSTWYHVAVDFDGTDYRLYLGGTVVATTTAADTIFDSSKKLSVGTDESGAARFLGWIDELRVSKGVAKYAGNSFTPPTGAYAH